MQQHVEQRELEVPDEFHAALEILRGEHPVEQRARQRLAGVDVRRHPFQDVPLPAEILHELAGQFDGVPLDALDARHAGHVDPGQQLVQPVAELVEDRDDLVVGERRGFPFHRRGQIAGEVRNRMLDVRTRVTTVDRVVHPCAALLAWPRVIVEVELAEQRAGRVGDVEKAHVGMPRRGWRSADRDAVERFDQRNSPESTRSSGKYARTS